MNGLHEVAILAAVRTPMGRYGGALAGARPDDLAASAIAAAVGSVPGLTPPHIDEIILGATNQAGEDNRNVARMAGLLAALPDAPGYTVNRLCGSGLQAVNDAAAQIALGTAEIVIAGGVESMSRAPYVLPKQATAFGRAPEIYDTTIGWRMVNPRMPPEHTISMGLGAERLAARYGIAREEQDVFALRSHERAVAAAARGDFDAELVPLDVRGRHVGVDEPPRPDTTLERLAALAPAFDAAGTVTAGNSSPLNDGAAALVLASGSAAERLDATPLARLRAFTSAAVAPSDFGIAPAPAIRRLAKRTGVELRDVAHVELNEAFAAQVLACDRELRFDHERLNPLGGAIALGHPLGCSGARLVVTLVHALRRRGGGLGVASLCIAVGQGLATLVESG